MHPAAAESRQQPDHVGVDPEGDQGRRDHDPALRIASQPGTPDHVQHHPGPEEEQEHSAEARNACLEQRRPADCGEAQAVRQRIGQHIERVGH